MTLALMTDDVSTGEGPEVLATIARPDTALAIWHRDLPPALRTALAMVDLTQIDDLRTDILPGEELDDRLDAAGYPTAAIVPIAADVAALVRHHAALTGIGRVALRLEVVETDACHRFHADYVTLRTICTYIGPGTQWRRPDPSDTIMQVPTGMPAVFKGRLLLDPPTILHRSPPILGSGTLRLMLVLDPAPAG